MIKLLFFTIVLLTSLSCGTNYSTKSEEIISNTIEQDYIPLVQDTTLIKSWLKKVIIDYINGDDLKAAYDNMRSSLTDDYYTYKQDAINLEYGEDMTEEEFHQKWKVKYDTKYVGKGGFFSSQQDSGTIDITTCTFIKSLGDTAHIFNIVISDLYWNTNYTIDITVVSKDSKFLIDDVKEY